MNAVEIEAAISELAKQPFDPAEFPFAFLAAFGNKDTALHIAVCEAGAVGTTPSRRKAK
jgi:hypothetical protein